MTIAQVNTTLKDYLFNELGRLGDTTLDFSFQLPNKKWLEAKKDTDNWVNLYLLEVQENLELRENEWERTYLNGQVLEQKKPMYVNLYYLVTFYNIKKNTRDEHKYLEQVLLALSDFSNLAHNWINSEELLKEFSIELFPKPYSDEHLGLQLWTALDQDARPFIPLKITIPLSSQVTRSTAAVKIKELTYEKDEVSPNNESLLEGFLFSEVDKAPILDALIVLKKGTVTIKSTRSNDRGKFEFSNLINEELTLSISAESYKQKDVLLNHLKDISIRKMTIIMEKV